MPQQLVDHPVLFGECLSGGAAGSLARCCFGAIRRAACAALYWNDFLNLARKVGFTDPRLVTDSKITIRNAEVESLIGHIDFYSATYRLFKASASVCVT